MKRKIAVMLFGMALMTMLVAAATLKDIYIDDDTESKITASASTQGVSKETYVSNIVTQKVNENYRGELLNKVSPKLMQCYDDIKCIEDLNNWLDSR